MATELTETTDPVTRRFSVGEYYQMAELGLFCGQRVELIEGEVLQMSPQGALHSMCVALVQGALERTFGAGYWVRPQLPLRLRDDTEPEPDIAVVPGAPRDYREHPSTALLVVEVSDTSLAFDRQRKASLYASASVAEYWVLDVAHRQLEVFREPIADASQPFGFAYRQTAILAAKEKVSPSSRPNAHIAIESLLP